jgi:hypothetical protein
MLENTIFLLEKQIKEQEEIIQNEKLKIIKLTNDNKILSEQVSHRKKSREYIYKNFFRY